MLVSLRAAKQIPLGCTPLIPLPLRVAGADERSALMEPTKKFNHRVSDTVPCAAYFTVSEGNYFTGAANFTNPHGIYFTGAAVEPPTNKPVQTQLPPPQQPPRSPPAAPPLPSATGTPSTPLYHKAAALRHKNCIFLPHPARGFCQNIHLIWKFSK